MPRGRPKKDKTLELATLVQENTDISQQEVEILPVEEVEIMSLSQLQKEKQELANRRARVLLANDKNRVEQSKKIIEKMSKILDRIDGYYDEDGQLVVTSPMDAKFLTEAYKNLITSYNMVTRLDSVDSAGKSSRLSLRIESKDGSVGAQIELNG